MSAFKSLVTRDRSGSVILELGMVAPLLVLMLFGCLEVTQLARAYMAVGTATQTIADLIARETDPNSPTVVADACNAGILVMGTFPSSSLAASAASVTNAPATGSVGVDWQNNACGGGGIAAPVALAAGLVSNPGDSVIIVQSTYTYQSLISFVLPATFTLSATAYSRPRGSVS